MRLTVRELGEDWIARRTTLRPQSVRNYGHTLRHYLAPLHDVRVECLTRRLVHELLESLARQGLGAGTVRNCRALLSALCRDAVDADVLATNPVAGLRTQRYRRAVPPRVLTEGERTHFLDTASHTRPELAALYWCLAYAGLRIGEGLALQGADVGGAVLHVRRSVLQSGAVMPAPKNGEWRDVEVPTALAWVLEPVAARAAPWLFPGPLGVRRYSAIWKATQAIAIAAGVPGVSPHDLRHTFASIMVARGVSLEWLRRALGHASIKITVDLYGRWLPIGRPPVLDRL